MIFVTLSSEKFGATTATSANTFIAHIQYVVNSLGQNVIDSRISREIRHLPRSRSLRLRRAEPGLATHSRPRTISMGFRPLSRASAHPTQSSGPAGPQIGVLDTRPVASTNQRSLGNDSPLKRAPSQSATSAGR